MVLADITSSLAYMNWFKTLLLSSRAGHENNIHISGLLTNITTMQSTEGTMIILVNKTKW